MALDGECIKETFYVIRKNVLSEPPVLELPASKLRTCCGSCSFKVLADLSSSDEHKNDVNGPHWFFPDVVSEATMKLLKFDRTTGDYNEVQDMDDTSLGEYYELGSFVNGFGEKFIGYQLEWKKVLALYGEGSYKVKVEFTNFLGSGELMSDEYCLHSYSPERADNTVRIDYYLNGEIGINTDDLGIRDYGSLNWFNSLRLRGVFSYVKSEYQKDYTQYSNGARKYVQDLQEPEFNLLLKPMCWNFHEIMRTDVLQADEIYITDYNSANFAKWISKSVQPITEYAPNFFLKQSELASITNLGFRQAANNLKRRKC